VRARKALVQQRANAINRVQKVLETANIKLASVASDVLGTSGRAMLEAHAGRCHPCWSTGRPGGKRLRTKLPAWREALEGRVEATHRALLRQLLTQIEFLDRQIEQLTAEIEPHLAPYEEVLRRLMQLPGIGRTTAAAMLAEIGPDMSRFPSAKHLASWAGVAPGNQQSGGKRPKAHTHKGNRHLRAVLAETVWVISHTKGNDLSAQYHRLARRIDKKRAIVAVSHSVLTIIYHLLRSNQDYHDLGAQFFATLDPERQRESTVRRLEALGYTVTLEPRKEESA
jgi:transposase